ncbi:zinc finger protein 397-like [Varanus komodoensis]|uniref:zinc finger protein 397-like n=1 Tax=Varanus komodoensis TaxID=61221 RepID=UPI001CF7B756|nr:zinc finger protein 397-like [Varanus komodoensis]XP_044275315.1 zinc finger protein 397-like [Varanus komodoensis]
MEELRPAKAGPETGGRGSPCVVQVGTLEELLTGAALQRVKKEPEEALHDPWEAQWQQLLRKMQPPQSGGEDPQLPRRRPQEGAAALPASSKAAVEARQESAGERVAQALGGGTREPSVKVKEEIPDEEGSAGVEVRCRRFRHFCYQEAKGPREAFKHLWALCCQWLVPERSTKVQMLELVVLEQFLAILPLEMRNWVRARGPETCAQAVTQAEGFLMQVQELRSAEQKVLGPLEEAAVNSPRLEQDVSNTVGLPVPVDDGQGSLLEADGHNWRKEESCGFRSPEKGATGGLVLTRAKAMSSQEAEVDVMSKSSQGSDIYLPKQREESERPLFLHEKCGKGLNRSASEEGVLKYTEGKVATRCQRNCCPSAVIPKNQKMQKLFECTYCGKICNNSAHLIIHERIHTGEKPHKCSECGKSFTQKGNLTTHKRIHMGEKPHQCRDCGKSFSRRQQLARHERIHSGEKPYRCSDCGKCFCRKDSLITHKGTHTREKPFECSDYRESFASSFAL